MDLLAFKSFMRENFIYKFIWYIIMPTTYYEGCPQERAAQFTIKHKDYFNLKELYYNLHEWLIEEGYASRTDLTFPETMMLERITQESGKEIWLRWRNEKSPTNSKFYRYVLYTDWHIILLKSAEVMHEGMKFKTNWGEVEFSVDARVIGDYERKWQKSPIFNRILPLFWNRIFRKDILMHRKELYRDAYRFQNEVKEFLKLKTFLPEPGTKFVSPLGLPKV